MSAPAKRTAAPESPPGPSPTTTQASNHERRLYQKHDTGNSDAPVELSFWQGSVRDGGLPFQVQTWPWSELPELFRGMSTLGPKGSSGYVVAARVTGCRCDANAGSATAIVVDYEPPPGTPSRWERWPAAIVAHTSASHTSAAERWRVYIQLIEPIPGQSYTAVRRALEARLPSGSKIRGRSQPAYMPTYLDGEPLPTVRIGDGPALDWRALPLEQHSARIRAERSPSDVQYTNDDATIVSELAGIWQKSTTGHQAFGALGGVLYDAGVSVDRAETIATLLADAVDSTHPDPIARVLEAYDDLHEMGWPKLIDALVRNGVGLPDMPGYPASARIKVVINQVERLIKASVEASAPMPATATTNVNATARAERTPAELGQDPIVNEIIARLSDPCANVYQRSGHLCTVTREAIEEHGVVRPAGAPTIRELTPARLREIIRTRCGDRDAKLWSEVMARGEWSYIRPLDAIVTYPIMRGDGTLLLMNGYDAATRTMAEINVAVNVPDAPTHADARAALAMLADLVSDFPFASEQHRSAWIAMLLTVPARPAIDGPTPLGLLEATQRGSGKSLLADLISMIVTGTEASRRVAPKDKAEWDKTLLSVLLAGDPIVLFDNVTTMLSSDALDAVLTGTTYAQRLLGVSEDRRVAIRTVFLVSANNARLSTDLVRRSVACRLEPAVERPETRTGFRHADLLGHARRHRVELLSATLTILRAYAVAGRPPVGARTMGSYASWCRVVRDALVWAGGTDPAVTQDGLRDSADVEGDELRELLSAWHAHIGDREITVRELLDASSQMVGGGEVTALRDALRGVMPGGAEPTSHAIGNRLRTFRGQIAGGLALREAAARKQNTVQWQVVRC